MANDLSIRRRVTVTGVYVVLVGLLHLAMRSALALVVVDGTISQASADLILKCASVIAVIVIALCAWGMLGPRGWVLHSNRWNRSTDTLA